MRRALIIGTALATSLATLAHAQTPPTQTPPPPTVPDQTPPATPAEPPTVTAPTVTVTAKQFDEGRQSIQPSLGASTYDFTPGTIATIPLGEQAPLNQVLLRAPSVVQDSFGQIHVRGDHGNLQYRLDGVQLPEGMSLFSNALATQYAAKMALITGALPAQYGFRTAGIIDITLKSGRSDPGAEATITGGSYNWLQPALSYGGSSGKSDWFVTGQFLHNDIGIENPAPTAYPIHDTTDQWHALAKATHIIDENTRLSFILGGAQASFQIPQLQGAVPTFTVLGNSATNSASLNQLQWENNYFAILSLQKHYTAADFQLSLFSRYSGLYYQPDPMGDLMFNGISPWANRQSLATGVQGDGSWKVTSEHTLRAGFLAQRERATTQTAAQVLPLDATGAPTSDVPGGILFGSDEIGWLFGVYLQDEWKLTPEVTVNFGARFDAYSPTQENQLSPRINVVWQPNDWLVAHAGYARYFTPPPLAQVNTNGIAATLGTTAAPQVTANSLVQAERADYFDAGFQVKPLQGLTLGFDAYYKIAQNLLDEGQFGAPIFLTSFNYANANIKGWELTASYDDGPWSVYGNLAWSQALAGSINSAQFNFAPDELAFIAQNTIFVDHDQSWTASAGAAYTFNQASEWATRVGADFIYGNGLRRTVVTPNDSSLPSYAVVNLSAAQRIPVKGTRGASLRLDVLNVFDNSYQIRDGTGVGVGAPQFGMRRAFLVTLNQKF
jgi:outer membrane receptor protein involved in Fe transport